MEEPTTLDSANMVLLSGIDAVVATHRKPRKNNVPAETGHPETSREFAQRMKDKFVLRGPKDRTEGGSGDKTTQAKERGDESTHDKERGDKEPTDLDRDHQNQVDQS